MNLQMTYFDAALPYRIDLVQRLDGAALSTQRRFYDGMGRLVQQQSGGAVLADNACSSDGDTSEDLCDVAVDTRFDAGGHVLQQTVPYALPANPAVPWRGQDLFRPLSFTVYDVLGRPRLATAADSTPTTWSYSTGGTSAPDGYRYTEVCQTNALAQTTCTRADLLGRVRKAIPPTGPAVAYSYDMEDQLLQVQRGGATTSLSYDLGGRKLQMNDPDMGVWNYAYDALGNLTRQADARGQRICLYYDGLNRLTGKQYRTDDACPSNPTLNVTYTYDSGTYAKGYRTGMVDPSGATSWTYDARGRMVQEKKVIGNDTFITQWGYNSADQVAWLKYPSDNLGGATAPLNVSYLPQQAVNSLSGLENVVQSASYDASGRVVARRLGASPTLVSSFGYYPWGQTGQGGRLQYLKAGTPGNLTSLQDYTYSYDPLGNISSILDNKAGGGQTQSFHYDALDRLGDAQASGGTQGTYLQELYTYHGTTGNLANKAGVSYSYNSQVSCLAGNRVIAHAVSAAGRNTYGYDCNGNMTQRVIGTMSYTLEYDAENRLTTVKQGSTILATFLYDGDGKRVRGEVNGVTTTYIGELAEWSNNAMTRYYYAGSERVAMNRGGALYFLLGDHLGSASIVATSSGGQYSKALFKPWGSDRYTIGTAPTTYRYTGQRVEDYIKLYWYGSRWYDNELGRWAQPDSIVPEAAQGVQAWDRYAYVNNSPVVFDDPSGHCIFGIDTIICVALAGAAIGAAVGYGAQVINNYRNGSSKPWTDDIGAEPIVGGAFLGTGAVIMAPAAVAVAGDVLVGAGVATGSTALFGAGMGAYGTAATIEHFYESGTTLPVLEFDSQQFPNIAPHIQDAQAAGQPSILTRMTDPALMKSNRVSATGGMVGLDEYPFASTYEGGVGASVRNVPAAENRLQGLRIAHFYWRNQIGDGDRFKVVAK